MNALTLLDACESATGILDDVAISQPTPEDLIIAIGFTPVCHEQLTWSILYEAIPTYQHLAVGKIHRGFYQSLKLLHPGVMKALSGHRPIKNLWITGHSRGGALAILLAGYLHNAWLYGTSTIRCVTFGAPAVGDSSYVKHFPALSVTRYEMAGDPVPWLPGLFWRSPGKVLCSQPWSPLHRWWAQRGQNLQHHALATAYRPWIASLPNEGEL